MEGIAKQQKPFYRSKDNSTDQAGSWETVQEELLSYKDRGESFDTVCLLQPTSPLRRAEDIKKSYALLEEKNADAITSVCEVEYPIYHG